MVVKGVFEWIVEPNGNVSHRRFIENGTVTGNQIKSQKVKGELYGFNRF